MLQFTRTTSESNDFQNLVSQLDELLRILDGEEADLYAQFYTFDRIDHVIVAFENEIAVGCGAIIPYKGEIIEIKRMYVKEPYRGKGVASAILHELESWAMELGYKTSILETGKKQPDAIRLYSKNNYSLIENFGQYQHLSNSICFEKQLH